MITELTTNCEYIDNPSKKILFEQLKELSHDTLNFIYLGNKEYKDAWDIQKSLHEKVRNEELPSLVLYLEHNHVYTFGKNANKDFLLNSYPSDADVVDTDRGGQITYHGPGQLIGYPIINLQYYKKSVSWYMRSLEDVIILALEDFGIKANRKEGLTGVWVENNKICAMGVRLSKWTTMHGFALNNNPDMKYYDSMIPCGIFDYGVTSILNILGDKVSNKKLISVLSSKFLEIFQRSN